MANSSTDVAELILKAGSVGFDETRDKITRLEKRLEDLADAYEKGSMPRGDYIEKGRELAAALKGETEALGVAQAALDKFGDAETAAAVVSGRASDLIAQKAKEAADAQTKAAKDAARAQAQAAKDAARAQREADALQAQSQREAQVRANQRTRDIAKAQAERAKAAQQAAQDAQQAAAALGKEQNAVYAAELAMEEFAEATNKANTANQALGKGAAQTTNRMGGLKQTIQGLGYGISDVLSNNGPLGSKLQGLANNVSGIVGGIFSMFGKAGPVMMAVSAGMEIMATATGALLTAMDIKGFSDFFRLFETKLPFPQVADDIDGMKRALGRAKDGMEELEKRGRLTASELKKYNQLRAESLQLEKDITAESEKQERIKHAREQVGEDQRDRAQANAQSLIGDDGANRTDETLANVKKAMAKEAEYAIAADRARAQKDVDEYTTGGHTTEEIDAFTKKRMAEFDRESKGYMAGIEKAATKLFDDFLKGEKEATRRILALASGGFGVNFGKVPEKIKKASPEQKRWDDLVEWSSEQIDEQDKKETEKLERAGAANEAVDKDDIGAAARDATRLSAPNLAKQISRGEVGKKALQGDLNIAQVTEALVKAGVKNASRRAAEVMKELGRIADEQVQAQAEQTNKPLKEARATLVRERIAAENKAGNKLDEADIKRQIKEEEAGIKAGGYEDQAQAAIMGLAQQRMAGRGTLVNPQGKRVQVSNDQLFEIVRRQVGHLLSARNPWMDEQRVQDISTRVVAGAWEHFEEQIGAMQQRLPVAPPRRLVRRPPGVAGRPAPVAAGADAGDGGGADAARAARREAARKRDAARPPDPVGGGFMSVPPIDPARLSAFAPKPVAPPAPQGAGPAGNPDLLGVVKQDVGMTAALTNTVGQLNAEVGGLKRTLQTVMTALRGIDRDREQRQRAPFRVNP